MRSPVPAALRCTAVAAALVALATIGGGCGSTKLLGQWQDPHYSEGALRNVLVIAVRDDAMKRRVWEDSFAQGLKAKGVGATPSYVHFGDVLPDTMAVVNLVREKGYDGVIVTRRVGKTDKSYYVPGTTYREPTGTYRDWYTGMYTTMYREVTTPGYVETDEYIECETTVWALKSKGRLVWSGMSETVNPTSLSSFSRDVTNVVVPELVKAGIL